MTDFGPLKRVGGPVGQIVVSTPRIVIPFLRPAPPTFFIDDRPGEAVPWGSEMTVEVEQGEHHVVVSETGERSDVTDDVLFWVGDETVFVEFRLRNRWLPSRLVIEN